MEIMEVFVLKCSVCGRDLIVLTEKDYTANECCGLLMETDHEREQAYRDSNFIEWILENLPDRIGTNKSYLIGSEEIVKE
jgi:hypothetical protein